MSKVYFSKDIDKIIGKLDLSKLGKRVGIKVHFGEKGCTTFLNPEIVRKVYKKVKKSGRKVSLVECNVLYKGERTQASSHIKLAREHGFTGMNIDILDGEMGDEEIDVNGAKFGKGIERYDSFIILSHFKGHLMSGFGGAFKNLGMGLGSRAGKMNMHCNVSPFIKKENCTGCGLCIEHCDVNAIFLREGKAEIDDKKCVGCAMCIAVCPNKAMRIPWGSSTKEELEKKIVDYSKAIIDKFGKENFVYINILQNITADCDCVNKSQEPLIKDIGILISNDPVSIDKTSLDLVNEKLEKSFNGLQVKYAEKLGLGEAGYEIKRL